MKGWFEIPGVQAGDRTLAEQMMGLDPALAVCGGKTVLDLGCAEGLISLEFARAGAAEVLGLDCNLGAIARARRISGQPEGIAFGCDDLNQVVSGARDYAGQWDIVLALAILHKLHDPVAGTRYAGKAARERLVLRLPEGSTGLIRSKWDARAACDTGAVLTDEGLRLEQTLPGPRGELVQHWVRA